MSIITNAKEIADLVKKLGNVDLYRKIVELEGEIIELSGQNNHLVERTRELEQALKTKEALVFSKNVYWLGGEESRDGPYCQRCYDVTGKLVRLQPWDNQWACFECKHYYDR
ncbi:MAG TPA: hypothetical protein DCQ77_09080 [Betaproteobacteria bacterium]|nr:hypothetical protein [Betaproteobacteria bacterium]